MANIETARPAPAVALERPARRRRPLSLTAFLYILPAIIFAAIFLYVPSFSAIVHAFTDWDGASPPTFVGLGNFQQMVGDPQMQLSFVNVLKLTGFALLVELTVPLAVAKLILALRSPRLQHYFRVLFLLPAVVPLPLIALIWLYIYDPNVGLLNAGLKALHLGFMQQDWLGNPNFALYAIMFMGFPWVDGFGMLIYTAGLQAIPQEVIESTHIDGAGAWTRFLRIELPLIVGQFRLMSVLTIINGIQQFAIVLILTNGGPAFATYVPGLTMYNDAFYYNRMGYACAIGVSIFIVILILTIINLRYMRSATEYAVAR